MNKSEHFSPLSLGNMLILPNCRNARHLSQGVQHFVHTHPDALLLSHEMSIQSHLEGIIVLKTGRKERMG